MWPISYYSVIVRCIFVSNVCPIGDSIGVCFVLQKE